MHKCMNPGKFVNTKACSQVNDPVYAPVDSSTGKKGFALCGKKYMQPPPCVFVLSSFACFVLRSVVNDPVFAPVDPSTVEKGSCKVVRHKEMKILTESRELRVFRSHVSSLSTTSR